MMFAYYNFVFCVQCLRGFNMFSPSKQIQLGSSGCQFLALPCCSSSTWWGCFLHVSLAKAMLLRGSLSSNLTGAYHTRQSLCRQVGWLARMFQIDLNRGLLENSRPLKQHLVVFEGLTCTYWFFAALVARSLANVKFKKRAGAGRRKNKMSAK